MLGVLTLPAAAVLGLLAWRDALHLTIPKPRPPKPWRAEALVTPAEAKRRVDAPLHRSGGPSMVRAAG